MEYAISAFLRASKLGPSSKPDSPHHAIQRPVSLAPRSVFDSSSHATYSEPKGRRVTTVLLLAASAFASAFPESRLGCAPRG